MKGAGGTEGGIGSFWLGAIMVVAAIWMFLDSVSVGTHRHGYASRYYGGSMLITMAPMTLGIFLLFFNSKNPIGWIVTGLGALLIGVEVVSTLRFHMHLKLWQWLLLLIFGIGGSGLIARSLRDGSQRKVEE